jgi:hypothetical protein
MANKIRHYICGSYLLLKMILILNHLFTSKGGVINNSDSFTVPRKTKVKLFICTPLMHKRGKEAQLLSFLTLEPNGVGGQTQAPATSLLQNEPAVANGRA